MALQLAAGQTSRPKATLPLTQTQRDQIHQIAQAFWKARPKTAFEEWPAAERAQLMAKCKEFGPLPEGSLGDVVQILWSQAARLGPKFDGTAKKTITTPYGEAKFILKGSGKKKPLVIGLHGGGEGAGSADEPAGTWVLPDSIGMYPQGIRLVDDTWNTVHGERFILTLIEIAKAQFDVDPDRVYCMGFSMGGTGSWFMAGRHPDLLAGSCPCAGVVMASPKAQLPRKEDVTELQHGLIPNARNLAMWYFIGLADRNCMPGTYLYVQDMLTDLKQRDPTGYGEIHFTTYPKLPHAFPPGEPAAALKFIQKQKRKTFPPTLVWEYATSPFPRPTAADPSSRLQKRFFYWLRCDQPADRQTIRATIADNTVTLEVEGTAEGTKGITVLLNPRMFDPTKDVVVRSGGKEIYRGMTVPDLWTVVETLDAKLDTSMVFDRRIDL